jgi:hypothetical protein
MQSARFADRYCLCITAQPDTTPKSAYFRIGHHSGLSTFRNRPSSAIGLRNIRRSSQDELGARLRLSIKALRSLLEHEASLPGRKLVLWISHGWPFSSDLSRREEHEQEIYSTVEDLSTRMRRAVG